MTQPQMTFKRNIYTHDDSSKVFILAMLIPFVFSFFANYIAQAIANGQGVEVEVITSSIWFHLCYTLITLATYVGIWICYSKLKDISITAVSFRPKVKWHNYVISIMLGLVLLFGLQYLVQSFDEFLTFTGYPVDDSFGSVDPQNAGEYIYAIFALALVPAFCEELIYRGIIFNGLREKFSTGWAVGISAIMFAIVHQNLQQLIYPIIFGALLALIVARTGSLLASMVVHFINNFIVVTMRFIENMTGFSMKLPNTWVLYVVTAACLVAAMLIWFLVDRFYFKHKNHQQCEKTQEKTSYYLYISFAIAAVLYILNVVSYVMFS